MRRIALVLFIAGLAALSLLVFARSAQPTPVRADVVDLQAAGDTTGFARVDHPRPFTFPLDHGPHLEYQTEWWYYTGNLDASGGRHLGYQLTFFRRAIAPAAPPRVSDWATNQIYFAHFALTDLKSDSHFATERFSRGAAGLAGATGKPYHVWLEDWEVTSLSADGNRVHLRAEESGKTIDLTLTSLKPPVLQGDQGLSPKSSEPGNASYYYSLTRLTTEGTVKIGDEVLAVRGLSWMDHEFGTTMLSSDAAGWDWFSIQLSDGREVMFFQIRHKDGTTEPFSGGTLVEPDGATRHLTLDQVNLQVLDHWTSRASGGTYPSRWAMSIPSDGIQLNLAPYVQDQEMRVSIVYWEGAVQIKGRSQGDPVSGSGYVEMTGYATAK